MVQSAGNDSLQHSAIAAAERMLVLLLLEPGGEEIDLRKLTMFIWECCIHSGFRSDNRRTNEKCIENRPECLMTMARYAWN
jgi:hypothetical protein